MGFKDNFKPSNPPPCRGCEERTEYGKCHDTCSKYIEFTIKNKAVNQERHNIGQATGNIIDSVRRCRRGKV